MPTVHPSRVRAELSPFIGNLGVALLGLGGSILLGCQAQLPAPPRPKVQPLDASFGRVTSVNPHLGFVVLDFTLSRPPQPGDRLEVSRAGTMVGELKTGYHQRGTTLVADIVRGEPHVGDEVRPVETAAAATARVPE